MSRLEKLANEYAVKQLEREIKSTSEQVFSDYVCTQTGRRPLAGDYSLELLFSKEDKKGTLRFDGEGVHLDFPAEKEKQDQLLQMYSYENITLRFEEYRKEALVLDERLAQLRKEMPDIRSNLLLHSAYKALESKKYCKDAGKFCYVILKGQDDSLCEILGVTKNELALVKTTTERVYGKEIAQIMQQLFY